MFLKCFLIFAKFQPHVEKFQYIDMFLVKKACIIDFMRARHLLSMPRHLLSMIYSQVPNKRPPRLLLFGFFSNPPPTLLGPPVY